MMNVSQGIRLCAVLVLSVSVLGFGCGGGGGDGVTPIVAAFAPSGTASAPNLVRLTGSAVGDTVVVRVVIAGPTTSTDIYAFAFDLTLSNASIAQYVAGSATFGNALTLTGGQTSFVIASQTGPTVTVGVTKLGGGSGNGIGASEPTVVTLTFRIVQRGMTTLGFSTGPPPPAAINSGTPPVVIPSVTFDTAAATLSGT